MGVLTDIEIDSLKPGKTPYRKFDSDGTGKGSAVPGFGVQVSPGGRKSFFLQYKSPTRSKRRFFSLGAYPEKSLANARKDARRARVQIDDGLDPADVRDQSIAQEKAAIAEKERTAKLGTVERLFELYVADMEANGKRSHPEVWRAYKGNVKDELGDRVANTVTKEELSDLIGKVFNRGALTMANRLRSYLISAFKFGIEHDLSPAYSKSRKTIIFDLPFNPARDIPRPLKSEAVGERYLTAKELKKLWPLLGNEEYISPQVGNLLKMLVASGGQRVIELLRSSTDQFDLKRNLWDIPADHTKNNKPHVVPIGSVLAGLVKQQRVIAAGELMFPKRTNRDEHMDLSSVSTAVARFCKEAKFERFSARDLRRTVKTLMGEIGISKEDRDRLQNHARSDVSSKHYDRYEYLREKKSTLASWNRHLKQEILGR